MPFWVYSESQGETCAGAKIGASMHFFSNDLFESCKYNAHLAGTAETKFQIRTANMSCLLFSVSAIEAKLNELIAMFALATGDGSVWSDVLINHQRQPTSQKWNLITERTKGTSWDNTKEPFHSYSIVKALRNELVHYKGELLGQDEAPNPKIQEIMRKLGVKSNASFIEDDCSSWVNDLLDCRHLGGYVVDSILPIWDNMPRFLGSEISVGEG